MTRTTLLRRLGRTLKTAKAPVKQEFKPVWTSWTFSDFLDFVRCGLVRTFGRASLEASKSSNPVNVQGPIAPCGRAFGYSPLDQEEDGNQQLRRLGHIVLTIEESVRRFAGKRGEAVRRIGKTYRYGAVFKSAVRPRSLMHIGAGMFDRCRSARHG